MKAVFAVLLAAGTLAAPMASAAPVCLEMRDIVSTHSNDGKILEIKMRDGRTLYNHLRGTCSDLKFNGFVWVAHGPDTVCEDQQSLRVLQSGQVCVLGKFGPAPGAQSTEKAG